MVSLYLDPGSGSFLLQLLIAGLAGIGIAVAAQWSRIKRFLRKKKGELPASDEEDDEE